MLLDANGAIIYGRPALLADTRRVPVEVDDALVGFDQFHRLCTVSARTLHTERLS